MRVTYDKISCTLVLKEQTPDIVLTDPVLISLDGLNILVTALGRF